MMSGLKELATRRSAFHRLKYLESFGDNEDGVWFELNLEILKETDGIKQQEDNHELQSEPGEQSALRSTRHDDGKGASRDVVDMAIKGAQDVSHGMKRPLSTNKDMVYIFSWIDMLIAVSTIIVFLVDIITDIKLAVEYFLDAQWAIAGVTTALIVIPSFITCGLSLHWYIIDFKIEEQVILKSKEVQKRVYVASEKLWFCRFFFTVLQLGPLVRTVEYFYYGCKSRSKNISEQDKKRYFQWMLYEDVDNCLLRLFESFLESAPQLCWQLYIFVKTKPEDNVIGEATRAVALLSSWGSLAVSLVSYHRSLRFSRDDKENLSLRSLPFYFIWRASETGGRVLCIALFASAFDQWVFAFLLFHWVITSGWLMSQHTTFYKNKCCLEKAFNVICGYVMLFCFLNLREGHTRFRYLLFYFLFYVENFVMLAFWFRFTSDLGAWFHIWGFILVLILFVLHVGSQLLYYVSFHPTHSIKLCLPCDKYEVYSSICYEVHPDTDDAVESPNEHYTRREISHGEETDAKLPRRISRGEVEAESLQEVRPVKKSRLYIKKKVSYQDQISPSHSDAGNSNAEGKAFI